MFSQPLKAFFSFSTSSLHRCWRQRKKNSSVIFEDFRREKIGESSTGWILQIEQNWQIPYLPPSLLSLIRKTEAAAS